MFKRVSVVRNLIKVNRLLGEALYKLELNEDPSML